jgi:hypothetical protein
MKIRRVAVAGVALFALAGLVGGCATKNGTNAAASSTPAASPTLAPKDALLASTRSLASASYKFTIKAAGLTGSGSADGANSLIQAAITGQEQNVSIKMDMIVVKTNLYLKMDFGPLNSAVGIQPDKYMHLDGTKLGANSTLPLGTSKEPVDAAGLLAGLTDVKTTDGKTYTGTVDLTKVTGDNAPDADALKKAGDKAKSVPFTAVLDDRGRLTDLKIDGASIDPQLAFEATFSDFGKASGVTEPDSSQVIEAPDSVMKMFQTS